MMKKKGVVLLFLLSFFLLVIDQGTKWLVVNQIPYGKSISIFPNFFRLTYVKNTGAAWSLFMGNQILLIVMTLTVLFFFFLYLYKKESINKFDILIYGGLLGGIFGNLIDRIRLNYVIDFFDFTIFHYNFPVFNVADIFIVLAGMILIIKIFKEGDSNVVRK
jgi:signal peptidase II